MSLPRKGVEWHRRTRSSCPPTARCIDSYGNRRIWRIPTSNDTPNVTLRCSNAASPAVAVLDLPCVGKLTTFGSRTHHVRFVETLIAVVHATLSTNSISCFLSSCNKLVVFVLTAMMMELYASIEWKWLDGNGTHKQLYIDADFSFYILNQLYIDLFLSWLIYIFDREQNKASSSHMITSKWKKQIIYATIVKEKYHMYDR